MIQDDKRMQRRRPVVSVSGNIVDKRTRLYEKDCGVTETKEPSASVALIWRLEGGNYALVSVTETDNPMHVTSAGREAGRRIH